jgi:hypothetical protein
MNHMKVAATIVGDEHRRYSEAKAEKAEVEDELLRVVLEMVRPALPALCTMETVWGRTLRAVRLPCSILLLEDGTFFGGAGARALNLDDVLDELSVVDIVTVLSAALNAQMGTRVKVTETIKKETRTIEAILLALKVGGIK